MDQLIDRSLPTSKCRTIVGYTSSPLRGSSGTVWLFFSGNELLGVSSRTFADWTQEDTKQIYQ
ncbi:hypothetical protein P6709_19810, partial [Jeotgalibacillus sp. ET6]|uniref:hypothetical protein n=1 Tax=Jeotgalibacillus sp. ET6 TaxID=3037260 RepID=UPI0024185AC4